MVIILALLAIIGTLLAPFIVRVVAFGFADDPAKLALTVRMTRIMFSFIFFIGLTAYVMGVLNTLKHFVAPAAGSCFLNITMIIFGLYLCRYFSEPVIGLAVAVLIGGFLQLCIQIPPLLKEGFRFRFSFQFRHPAIARIGRLLIPRMVGSSIYQLNIFADTMFASLGKIVGEGAVAALYYANRLIQFPTAIFGIAMATACLPTMSRQAVANDIEPMKKTLMTGLQSLVVLLIPSTVGLFILAHPTVSVLFQRGAFDTVSTDITRLALIFYCIGIYAYSGARLVTTCFYAMRDTTTPVLITFICLVVNVVLNYLLMWPLQVGGLALATSVSSTVNFFLLIYVLRKKIGPLGCVKVLRTFLPVSIASLGMAVICRFSFDYYVQHLSTSLSLLLTIMTGMVAYAVLGWILGVFKGVHLRLWH